MFANLKNKLIEEVKASPSKFQQFAAAVSSSASTTSNASDSAATTASNENFFSITEEDTPQNSPHKPLKPGAGAVGGRGRGASLNNGTVTGAIPRTRRLSNSSMASDTSFRLPSYDLPPVYHLQSDLESNCSELEDSASISKLDVITKEQLYDAYRKSLDRYHKYRCRYTDLAKKYKDLERDSSKARSVLVETQEKAIRRISELREQCSLEQQAKAHLEEALRIEMDDMQCKMRAYETKLKLLGENPENVTLSLNENESLIDLGSHTDSLLPTQAELVNVSPATGNDLTNETTIKIAELQLELQKREQQIQELTEKLNNSESMIESLCKKEEENALLLAQTKQAIHSELESKESEVKRLTDNIKKLQLEIQSAGNKENELNAEVGELKELREKFKQLQLTKQESDARVIATEHLLAKLRADFAEKEKELAAVKEKLASSANEFDEKLRDLRQQNLQLNEIMQRYQQNQVSLVEIDNELNGARSENDALKAAALENGQKLVSLEEELKKEREHLASSNEERAAAEERFVETQAKLMELEEQLKAELSCGEAHKEQIKQLEFQVRILNEQVVNNESETVGTLKAELHKQNSEMGEQLKSVNEQLASKEKELKSVVAKLNKQKKQHDSQKNRIMEQSDEIEKLKIELNKHEQYLASIQGETRQREEQSEREKNELKVQIANILHEIAEMEEQMLVVKKSHAELEIEKRNLERKIEEMQKRTQEANDGEQHWRKQLEEREDKLRQLEMKLQNVESENSQLAEKNCLLEENKNRLDKLLAERERQQSADAQNTNALRMKLEAAEEAVQKINEKMSQVLDENSRMQNVQELMDHDQRTLQDKYDALEKEKLLAEDACSSIQVALDQLKERKTAAETKVLETMETLQKLEDNFAEQKKNLDSITEQLRESMAQRASLLVDKEKLEVQIENFSDARDLGVDTMERELNEKKEIIAKMNEDIEILHQLAADSKKETDSLRENCEMCKRELEEKNQELSKKSETLLQIKEKLQSLEALQVQNQDLKQHLQKLNDEMDKFKNTVKDQQNLINEQQQKEKKLEEEVGQGKAVREQLQSLQKQLQQLHEVEHQLRSDLADTQEKSANQIQELEDKLAMANSDLERLHESNDAFQVQIDQLKSKHQLQVDDLESTLKKLQQQSAISQKNAEQSARYEQMQLENEYLNNHVKQLEKELEQHRLETQDKQREAAETNEKLKSLQCELYVLRENAEKHDEQMSQKQTEITDMSAECGLLKETARAQGEDLQNQSEYVKFITEQNDAIQKELLQTQQQLDEVKHKLEAAVARLEQETIKAHQADALSEERLQQSDSDLVQKVTVAVNESKPSGNSDAENLRRINEQLQCELEELKQKSTTRIEGLQQEVDDLQNSNKQLSERMLELERLRAGLQAQQLFFGAGNEKRPEGAISETENTDKEGAAMSFSAMEKLQEEKAELQAKLIEIHSDVEEVSQRNQFLEQQCENYLILEQSNERLKLQNAKLARQLDETLVSMQHNENIAANTEFEYLKNIMFQYLTGSANGNNETLVKVISAVLKFSPQQTQVALEKEHQRRSLLNKIL